MTWYKVTIDGTDYEEEFVSVQVTGRESGVASANLIADNKAGAFWTDTVDVFDDISIQMRAVTHATPQGGSLQSLFTGTVREVKPYASSEGFYTRIACKGLGAALEETHCKDTFGYTSIQPTLNTIEEIIEDLVDNSINKSYSSANNTGYAITKTYIPTIDAGLSIPFFNAPYQTCRGVVDLLCTLDTAYRAGATAGPHWFVDSSGNLRVKTIGTQQADGGGGGGDWGIYYGGGADSTDAKLYEDEDFYEYTLTKPTDQYANSVVLAFDLRRPAWDYWTTDAVANNLWGDVDVTQADDATGGGAGEVPVGNDCLKATCDAAALSYLYYPSTEDAGWDTSTWGSKANPPSINFYFQINNKVLNAYLALFTTDHDEDAYVIDISAPGAMAVDTWYHFSFPVGPYWATKAESQLNRWSNGDAGAAIAAGAPDWTDINGIAFIFAETAADGIIWIDDLHFSGKCIREAVALGGETDPDPHPNNQYQHTILSRTPLDDTAVASDDSGLAGQICYGELLRRVTPPRTFTCTVPFKPLLKPGEYFEVYAGKTGAGSYKLNGVDFRVTQYTHFCTQQNRPQTSLVMNDDVKNSFPLGPLDARAVLNEYLLVNNSKATDMQGGDVDLLIPHLRKTY